LFVVVLKEVNFAAQIFVIVQVGLVLLRPDVAPSRVV
jgi:hypothetical protein